jgi:hypothetical protein
MPTKHAGDAGDAGMHVSNKDKKKMMKLYRVFLTLSLLKKGRQVLTA